MCYHEVTDCCRTLYLCAFDPEFVCGCAMNFLPSDWNNSLLACSSLFYMILAIIQIEFLLVVSICRQFLLVTWNARCILWNCQGKYQTGKHFSLPKFIQVSLLIYLFIFVICNLWFCMMTWEQLFSIFS